MKKMISLILITTQASFATLAWADNSETALLENVIALQGQKLSASEMTTQSQKILSNYLASANPEGAQQRLEQALVTLGIYTPAQAAAFSADAQSAGARLSAAKITDQQKRSALFAQEISRVAEMHPTGAQFSSCTLTKVVVIGAIGGSLVGIGALLSESGTVTCYTEACANSNPEPATAIAEASWGVAVGSMVVGIIANYLGYFGCDD